MSTKEPDAEVVASPTVEITEEPVIEVTTPEDEKDASWWKARASAVIKDNDKLAKKLTKFETEQQERMDAEKSELQKAKEAAEKLAQKNHDLEISILKRDIAAEYKLSPALAKRLNGETAEELKADAEELLAALPAKVAPKIDPTNPGGLQTGETDAERRKRLGL